MKHLVAELDRISAYVEELNEPWGISITWRLDKVAQELEELSNNKQSDPKLAKINKISKKVLSQYMVNMEFLSDNDSKLSKLIMTQDTAEAKEVYRNIKNHFGKISRKEAIDFIKNVIKNKK